MTILFTTAWPGLLTTAFGPNPNHIVPGSVRWKFAAKSAGKSFITNLPLDSGPTLSTDEQTPTV